MHIFAVSAFLFALAVLFGIFEIEAEGKFGWAEKFPTWYRTGGLAKVYTFFTNKPLTGYHLALFFVPLFIFVWPMVATSTLSWHGILRALSFYFAWVILWDFTWFVLNPDYGVHRFRRSNIWWLAKEAWILGLPSSYLTSLAASLIFAVLSGALHGGWQNALWAQAQQLVWYFTFTCVLIGVGAPLFREYYYNMRKRDDRGSTNIFHKP